MRSPSAGAAARTRRRAQQQQQQQQREDRLCNVFETVPFLTPALRRWLIRRFRSTMTDDAAYANLSYLKKALLALQPSLPSSLISTPTCLQAAFLQPPVPKALLLYCARMERKSNLGKEGAARLSRALNCFFAHLKVTSAGVDGGVRLVRVGDEGKGWEGWREEEVEKEEQEEEKEEEEGEKQQKEVELEDKEAKE